MMPHLSQHSVSVAAVVTDSDRRVLMIQRRDNGHWEPPGGVLEVEEDIIDGLCREVREETGLDVEPERLTGVYKNMPRGIVALVFRAHIVGGTFVESTDETARLRWLTPAEVNTYCDEAYAIRVADAMADDHPAIRAHDGVRLLRDLAALPN